MESQVNPVKNAKSSITGNGTDKLQVKKRVCTMKNLIPSGDKKVAINSSRINDAKSKIIKTRTNISLDLSKLSILNYYYPSCSAIPQLLCLRYLGLTPLLRFGWLLKQKYRIVD